MEWLSVLLLLVTSSGLFLSKTTSSESMTLNYVTPNKTTPCPKEQRPCLTLIEYASEQDIYFVNNTGFHFNPGTHALSDSLKLKNVYNFSFQGISTSSGPGVANIALYSSASITLENSENIQISSISFALHDNFTFIFRFELSQFIQLSNLSLFGNGYSGCSSIISQESNLDIKNSMFSEIKGVLGAVLMMLASNITFGGTNTFFDNIAVSGGSIYLSDSMLTLNGSNIFLNNTSLNYDLIKNIAHCNYYVDTDKSDIGNGGAIFCKTSYLTVYDHSNFTGNVAETLGGAIEVDTGNFTIQGVASFDRNKAYVVGGSLHCWKSDVRFIGTMYFNENSNSAIGSHEYIYFYRNTGYEGGAIQSADSKVLFSGSVLFEGNMADSGGAILLKGTSKLIFKPKLNISFILNHANDSGGALYYGDINCSLGFAVQIECFISIDGPFASTKDISLYFVNNSAGSTGSVLYGGQFDKCRLFFKTSTEEPGQCICIDDDHNNALETLMNMSTIVQYENNSVLSIVPSPVEKIRFCEGGDIEHNYTMHPGQQFNVSFLALGKANFLSTKIWEQSFGYYNIKDRLSPVRQYTGSLCTNVTFQLYSVNPPIDLHFELLPNNPCQNQAEGVTLHINVLPCPLGFELSKKEYTCLCDKKLKRFTQNCYILESDSELVERITNTFWIHKENNETLILHEFRCPLDYCTNNPLNVSLSNPMMQCDFNRDGTVCGQCQKNFSLALGSLHCIPCDNNHAALIVLFVMAGISLIAIIFFLRLTAAVGTLNGLFFYANIIQANQQAFFPRATINPFTVFISWLNLDLGIETCFYKGMNIYAYSWLQFLFPFYVWLLIGYIIVACRYSQSFAKQLGQNPVAVLATLLLISYSKILQAIIVPLSWTYLIYYHGNSASEYHSNVWLYDASIHFFKEPKHIALGVFAIFSLVILVIPYILLLLFGQWLQGCSNWWILSWLNKIKPFMDAYHAPYKKHTRYWTGLLLLSRLGLFLTFAINTNGSESINILAVSSVAITLLAIQGRVYEHWGKNLLESSFILNLGIFSVATFYLKEESEDEKNQHILSGISVGIAFLTFIGILLFHISLILRSSSIWKVRMFPFIQKSLLLSTIFRITLVKDNTTVGDTKNTELHALPTSTEIDVDLHEPLL